MVRWRLVFADSGYNYIRKSVDFRRLVGFILEISISVGYLRYVSYKTSFRLHFRYAFAPFARRAVTGRVSLSARAARVSAGWCRVGRRRLAVVRSARAGVGWLCARDTNCVRIRRLIESYGGGSRAWHVAGELRERGVASRVAGWWWWSAWRV